MMTDDQNPNIQVEITDANAWKRGLRRQQPGIYVDDQGAMHFDLNELLRANGYAVTLENEAMIRRALADQLPNATIEDV